jgi:dihydroorotase
MKLLLRKGTVIEPSAGTMDVLDILISDSRIKEVGSDIVDEEALIIDAQNKWIVPGLVDAHVHFRQPGQEYKEDIYTGSRAAAAGGFTAVIAEPNTYPPIDTPARLAEVLQIASKQSIVDFYSKACITVGAKGERLTDVERLKAAGATAISDDGHPVAGRILMRNALRKGKEYGILVNPHCEESELYRERIMKKRKNGNQKTPLPVSMPYSRSQEPYTSESGFIERDVRLAEKTGARIHISHVSFARSVELIAKAKKRGVSVTAEATPHHFLLTRDMAKEIGSNAKVNPPLRSREDVQAVKQGLADGTIDIIASDHAPHSPEEKSLPWEQAPFGIIGLETTLGLALTYLVRPGILTKAEAINKMTNLPARIFGLEDWVGTLTLGERGDVTIIDPEIKWKVDANEFYSKGRNCPFNGWELQGKAVAVIVNGEIIMKDGRVIEK